MGKLDKKIMENSDCSPLSSIYGNAKLRVTGNLNQKDLKNLYDCNLCNHCHLAGLNRSTREKSVKKGFISHHVTKIRENILKHGNSYGIENINIERVKWTEAIGTTRKNSNIETILFRGCTPTYKTPGILKSAENLLKSQGIEYEVMDDETCCGNILFNLGDVSAGYGAVQRNIDKFKARGVKRIITICPGCYSAFNKYYAKIAGFNLEVILLVDLLEDLTLEGDFTVQDSCHAREKGVKVRKILSEASNKSPSPCCGAGGGVMAHNLALATSKALKTLEDTNMVTYCPFCYLNLSSVSENQVEDIYMLLDKNCFMSPESVPY